MVGYRKLTAACVALALSTLLLVLHYLTGDNWVMFNGAQLGLFFGTNCAAKLWGNDSEPS